MNRPTWTAALVAAWGIVGCSTMPRMDPAVESARASVSAIEADPAVARYAPLELANTREAWLRAEHAWREGDSDERVHHLAYLADRQAMLARETARLHAAQAAIAQAGAERTRIELAARTREAERARDEAARAQASAEQQARQVEVARTRALMQAQEAERARAAAAAAAERARAEHEHATAANAALSELRERTERLATQVEGLKASATDRGTVITLGDVLFDVDRATLKPGGERAVRELASALEDGTGSSITVAGFTDASGTDQYNQALSEQRAQAVRNVLVEAGVPPARIVVRGYGEAYPVATNATTAGRQLNRRVEVFVDERNAPTRSTSAAPAGTQRGAL